MSLRTLSDAALADRYDAVLMPGGVFLQSGRQFTRAEFEAWLAHGGPSVPDPVADTARALAGLWTANDREWTDALMGRIPLATANERYTDRALAIEDAARTCGSQVYAAFCALVTGDAGREVGNG